MHKKILKTIAAAMMAAALSPAGVWAQQATQTAALVPFTGQSGYQELKLGGDSWYLAFHGTRNDVITLVEAGWMGRAGQLCEAAHKAYVVELRYVDEPVYLTDPVASNDDGLEIVKVRSGPIFIPIYTPSGPRNVSPTLTPTKAAPLRCINETTGLRPGKAAVPVADAINTARTAGMPIPVK
jgi:hypothetical protein